MAKKKTAAKPNTEAKIPDKGVINPGGPAGNPGGKKRAEALAKKREEQAKLKVAEEKAAEKAAADAIVAAQAAEKELLTGAELDEALIVATRSHQVGGRPEVAMRLKAMAANGEPISRHHVRTDGVDPFSTPAAVVSMPPLTGPGSTTANWRAFAHAVAGDKMGGTLIDEVDRDDLIMMLRVNGFIDEEVS